MFWNVENEKEMFKMKFKALLVLVLLLAMTVTSFATEGIQNVVFPIGEARYFVNNGLPGYEMDVKSFVVPGYDRTVIPVRFLSNALGVTDAHIEWIAADQKVILSQPGMPRVEMVIGEKFMTIDGKKVSNFGGTPMDIAPLMAPVPGHPLGWSRTFLPARFVAYALGYKVDWDQDLNLAIIWKDGAVEDLNLTVVKNELRADRGLEPELVIPPGYTSHRGFVFKTPDLDADRMRTVTIFPRTNSYRGTILDMSIDIDSPLREELLLEMADILIPKFGRERVTEWFALFDKRQYPTDGNCFNVDYTVGDYIVNIGGAGWSLGVSVIERRD